MRITHYTAVFGRGEPITLVGDGQFEPVVLDPPAPDDVDRGPMDDMTASEAVEMQRALSGWLSIHRDLHPKWHDEYRERDPGGKRRA